MILYADKTVYQNKDQDFLWTWKMCIYSQDIHSMFIKHWSVNFQNIII